MESSNGTTSFSAASSSPPANAGLKRKRASKSSSKFYAVRVGKAPGIYHTWAECFDQVNGFPKAAFKSFATLTDAQHFVNNESGSQAGKGAKFYGVQAGRTPGVYTDWQDVLDQITGWKGPKHKVFTSRTEAEQYVKEGQGTPSTTNGSTFGVGETGESSQKKAKANKSRKSNGVKEEVSPPPAIEQGEYEPGEAPLAPDVEDGFDTSIVLDRTTNGARYKTREEREKVRYQVSGPVQEAPIRIYTDGSSLSNGQASALGGVGVYFGPGDKRNVSEPLSGTKQTNQRAELTAMLRGLEVAPRDRKIIIVSDSKYAIDCVTDWFQNWQRNGWVNAAKKPVENKDLVQKILDLLEERFRLNRHRMGDGENIAAETDKRSHWDRGPGGVRFEWVKGHDKDKGNNAADSLAVAGARTAQELGGQVNLDD